MLNPFKPPELIKAETFMSMPQKFHHRGRTNRPDAGRGQDDVRPTVGREASRDRRPAYG